MCWGARVPLLPENLTEARRWRRTRPHTGGTGQALESLLQGWPLDTSRQPARWPSSRGAGAWAACTRRGTLPAASRSCPRNRVGPQQRPSLLPGPMAPAENLKGLAERARPRVCRWPNWSPSERATGSRAAVGSGARPALPPEGRGHVERLQAVHPGDVQGGPPVSPWGAWTWGTGQRTYTGLGCTPGSS